MGRSVPKVNNHTQIMQTAVVRDPRVDIPTMRFLPLISNTIETYSYNNNSCTAGADRSSIAEKIEK